MAAFRFESALPQAAHWRDQAVLITGVCGTVGSELLRLLCRTDVKRIVGLDNNESALFYLEEQYRSRADIELYLCDVRHRSELDRHMRGIDIVLHCAALKHVRLCERAPATTVATNIQGVQNIIESSVACSAKRVLFTSSDKAVNPTNVMGTSKLMGERLVTAADHSSNGPIFASTRFGNVLGSNGSVVPLFRKQILAGGPLTLTDRRMTRFVMTLSDAAQLVMDSVFLACGGEVFVTKMPVVRISDLAQVMIDELTKELGFSPTSIEVETIGTKPGEKMHEELLNEEEARRAHEIDKYFVVVPAFGSNGRRDYRYPGASQHAVERSYSSNLEQAISLPEIRTLLHRSRLLKERR